MINKYGEIVCAYDLGEFGGVKKTCRQLGSDLKYDSAGKLYDLGFHSQLEKARKNKIRSLESNANN